jgi:crossover junction endodeoxyribonuclease RuvC
MRILGIDPGVAITGYGVIEECDTVYRCIASGCIRTASDVKPEIRLLTIYEQINKLVEEFKPQALVVEKIFFSKNVATAFQVGEARGVVLLIAACSGLALFEYTPLQVKQAVAGYGKAEKVQVQKMVQLLLKLQEQPAVDDEADAMAVALCHLQNRRFQDAVRGGKS